MIKIERDDFEKLAGKWFELLIKPVKGNEKNIFDKLNEHLSTQPTLEFLLKPSTLKIIITSKPKELRRFSIVFKRYFPVLFKDATGENPIKKAFDYEFFINKFGDKLAKNLCINVCPYCNRNFTNTVFRPNGKKIIRPDFDHFFSQKDHPLLALSFFNLIPSCQICNSRLKGKKEFKLKTHFHPYINGFEDDISFNYLPKSATGVYGVPDKYSIIFEKKAGISKEASNRLKGSKDVFQYGAIYEQHGDILEELVAKLYKGGQTYLDSIRNSFPGLNLNDQEMYRIAYGNFMDTTDHEKRPFAKLTKDIFEMLGPDLKL